MNMPMVNNSTLFLIIDESNNRSEIIDINKLNNLEDEITTELDVLFSTIDYSPSDEVINRILSQI